MSRRLYQLQARDRLLPALTFAAFGAGFAAFAVVLARSYGSGLGLDYDWDAGPAISALAHGDLPQFFAHQPAMGMLSLVLRAPFTLLAPAGNVDAAYALGLLPCAVLVLLVLRALKRELTIRWGVAPSATVVPALCALGIPVLEALVYGHPEEPLGAALCLGAALAALQRRPWMTGILLGLAVVTKQWGAFAALPILAAGTGSRPRTALAAIAIATLLTVPAWVADAGQFGIANHGATTAAAVGTPLNVWAPLGTKLDGVGLGGFGARIAEPGVAQQLSRPLMAAAILATALAVALGRLRRREDLLAMLALVFLARCLFDPLDNVYYHVPFLMLLAGWEGVRYARVPALSLLAAIALAALALLTRLAPGEIWLAAGLYLACMLAVAMAVVRASLSVDRGLPAAEGVEAALEGVRDVTRHRGAVSAS